MMKKKTNINNILTFCYTHIAFSAVNGNCIPEGIDIVIPGFKTNK